ncbi:DUF5722 domain-containing protein [Verrucomicrobiales bacterium BCK34]|nr:DUF5722 domain-containing protein [Verrucomicrobiales bacterium BCK34]
MQKILFFFLFGLSCLADAEVPLVLGPFRGVEVKPVPGGVTELTINGPGPHFWSGPVRTDFDPDKHTVLSFEYFSPSGMKNISLKYRQTDGGMTQADVKELPLAETWQPFALDISEGNPAPPQGDPKMRFHFSLSGKVGDSFQIRNVKVRPPTEEEKILKATKVERERATADDAEAYLQYLRDWYPNGITSVVIEENQIRISGKAEESVSLVELRVNEASHSVASEAPLATELKGEFKTVVKRFSPDGKVDRALSRWRLDKPDGKPASLCRWGDSVAEGIARDLPELKATHQKGLGGVPHIGGTNHEIFDLGIAHATMNIVLNAMISETRRPGLTPFPFEGKTYFINPQFMAGKIATIKNLCEKDVIVTCILLVGNQKGQTMTHPEAEIRGTFAMPNLATEAGAQLYRAAIHYLAETFSKPEARVSNWVIHNEIDQAGTWTNMGDQPLARYLETYVRSMRTVFTTTRLFDPHARTFISLTHHWTKPSLGKGAYTVREMVELFSEITKAEGDFEWGVAYHPYPRNLRDPDTWDDEDVTRDFDTPYITPKNMEVLPAFLAQDRFRFRGEEERAILFSEQGFNSPTLSEEDQKRQAAGLLYAFRKLPHLKTVEAYHLHRYQDMPDQEGGLRVGIIDEHGNHKLGWDVYKAIGTGRESEYDELAASYYPAEAAQVGEVNPPAKPNIVYLVADDLGWSDTTPYLDPNEDFYETPNIAALAKRGMKFTNAYAASPLCSPTRASILTGQYPGRIRLTTPACHVPAVVLNPTVGATAKPAQAAVEPGTRTRFPNFYETIPERLRKVGYQSAFVGKWHLGRAPYFPDHQGFDLVIGGREHPGPPGGFFAPWPIETIPKSPEGSHIDDVITTESIKWLEEKAKAGEPFFLNLWFYSVHAPFEAKPHLIEKYAAKAKGLPFNAPRKNPVMAAMIETLDDNVGRVVGTLDRLGLSENTFVVFTSDNGGNEYNYAANEIATNNHPLRNGKGNINEGGQRVPFIAAWPGKIKAESVNSGLVSSIDLFPTALAAASAPSAPGQVVDGTNLLPAFLGEEEIASDRELYCHFPHSPPATGTVGGTSVRRGPWKLTRFYADGYNQADRLRLINLNDDPGEMTDLSEGKPELVAELNEGISRHIEETGSLVPVPNPEYRPSADGWEANRNATLEEIDDFLIVKAIAKDPFIKTSDFGPAKGRLSVEITMRQENESGVALYWATKANPGFGPDRLLVVPRVSFGVWRADFDPGDDRLTSLRIDPAQVEGDVRIDSIRLIQWKGPGDGRTVRLWDF